MGYPHFLYRDSLTLRSSRPEMFYKNGVLRNLVKFTEKHLCQSLFSINFLLPKALLKKRPSYRCFPMNFAKVLRTPLFIEHHRWLLLILLGWLKWILCLWILWILSLTIVSKLRLGICRIGSFGNLWDIDKVDIEGTHWVCIDKVDTEGTLKELLLGILVNSLFQLWVVCYQ